MKWNNIKIFEDIKLEKSITAPLGIIKITINRPKVRNAFRPQTVFELKEAFELAREFTTKTFKLYLIGCPKQGDSNYETLINNLSNLEINLINNENDTMIQAPPSDIAIYSDFRQIGSVLKSVTFGNSVDLLNFNAILNFLTNPTHHHFF